MTQNLPEPVRKLAHALAELPGIGPRQATRLALFLVTQNGGLRKELMGQLGNLDGVKLCTRCFYIHQNSGELCNMCTDTSRDHAVILIIERETDLLSLENTGRFNGQYFIIGPVPKVGVLADWQKARLEGLKQFIQKELAPSTDLASSFGSAQDKSLRASSGSGQAREIILGFNPTSLGDFNATLIQKELGGLTKKMSRLGRGLPTGGEIEFADDDTLSAALSQRN